MPPSPQAGCRCLACPLHLKSQCDQLSTAGLGCPPLLPQDFAQAPTHPLIQHIERSFHTGESKVADPPPSEAIDFFDHHADVSSSSPVGNLTNPILGPMNGLWRMLGALPLAGRGRQGGQRGAVEKAV
jgi:hypothetical protein